MSQPIICTFESKNAPAEERWMAVFYVWGGSKKTGPKLERLPIHFSGTSEMDVMAAAAAFWANEQEKSAARAKAAAERATKRQQAH